ncbi:assimilatory sulfite reductase (NADPH) flavoprotein subunit [Ferrimonas senticii]|uniref:assimilatory sulfite reductase (NADPH) flavoprotein subunit n=1 Tax=Ferrimonas senticii TaxID=394566 RepID=UPI000400C266|nr:assimilatory sulfite reductase (NADPH) flavoprotein subunit [Ferrimonas senticii]
MLLNELQAGAGMLAPEQVTKLRALAAELTPVQAAWISGYLAALANQGASQVAAVAGENPAAVSDSSAALTILYGSQTGNGRSVAEQAGKAASEQGWAVTLKSMSDYKPKLLAQEQRLLLVVSTHGEGDPPDDALGFHKFVMGKRAPQLDGLQFSVLALGDSSYQQFCQTGKELDARLAELGASRIAERVDCDVDFADSANTWQQAIWQALPKPQSAAASAGTAQVLPFAQAETANFTKQSPYQAELIVSQKITGRNSSKDIRHVEIDLGDSEIRYQPGDALGIWLDNPSALVDEILLLLDLAGDSTIKQQLQSEYELTLLSPAVVKGWAALTGSEPLNNIINDGTQLRRFITSHQLVDLIKRYPLPSGTKVTADELTAMLRPLTPRLYSIASSQAEVGDEVHLTVAKVAEQRDGIERLGAVSGALATRLGEGDKLRVFVESNDRFRLPADATTPIIMIGPGTGIAPYRAFMQQRAADGIRGNSWLIFGNPHFTEDFLYQVEWQQYLASGELEKLTLAFSRDQPDKIYVQDRLREQASELWQWLERGAVLYLCGDASTMAPAVEQALKDIAAEQGQLDSEQAAEWLFELQQQKRFFKDVY